MDEDHITKGPVTPILPFEDAEELLKPSICTRQKLVMLKLLV